jgi:hypothetical protein
LKGLWQRFRARGYYKKLIRRASRPIDHDRKVLTLSRRVGYVPRISESKGWKKQRIDPKADHDWWSSGGVQRNVALASIAFKVAVPRIA